MPKTKPKPSAAEELAGKASGRKPGRRRNVPTPYAPTARDLAWYLKWTRDGKGPQAIADECEPPIARSTVYVVLKRVDAWARLQLLDDIAEVRSRHLQMLERIIEEALTQWKTDFDVSHAELVRKALADIRKMLGVDKPISVNVETELPRVDGMTPSQAIRMTAATMLAAADTLGDRGTRE